MVTDIVVFIVQAAFVFVASATIFDALHFLLHRWQRSRFAILRMFSSWHQVHHEFLDKNMKVHPELGWRNFWAHLVPEYMSSMAGTAIFWAVLPMWPVVAILALHTVMFGARILEEGMDANHMAMDRLDGRRSVFGVNQSFHAMHHINPLGFYSSLVNTFDMIFGTAIALRGKRVLMTGASGAYGSVMRERLIKMGASVDALSATSLKDGSPLPDLSVYDLLVIAHGLKNGSPSAVWHANHYLPAQIGESYIAATVDRLVPAEIWYVGSESEVIGISDYAMSKRNMADYAAKYWFHSDSVTYRHIVPSAFRSPMGWGLMSAKTAVAWSLFLIRRGFRYIPVTYTGIAVLNRLRFVRRQQMRKVANVQR